MRSHRKGRLALPVEATLRRVAEYMVAQEELGNHSSARAAILHTSDGRVTGNSADADLWRLQRKWGRQGDKLLAEVRERRARARRSEPTGACGSSPKAFIGLADLATAFQQSEAVRAMRIHEEVMRAIRPQEEIMRAMHIQDEIVRAMRIQDEAARISW